MILPILGYDVIIEKGCLKRAEELLSLQRKVLVLTDSGVPSKYADSIASQCKDATVFCMEAGEENKTLATVEKILALMLEKGFSRGDCVVAVGGGIVGDVAGFTASAYMRGIDFYNIPTTLLSQIDSSVGGKTGVNLNGIKNIVGAFYQPKRVLIDVSLLATLDKRHISCGISEAVKMAVTSDREFFEFFERDLPFDAFVSEEMIFRALSIKKSIVEKDEKEQGLRRVLNFGHTLGHGIESLGGLYHGECVALGMLPMCAPQMRKRLEAVLKKFDLPTSFSFDTEKATAAVLHDKKAQNGGIYAIKTNEAGSWHGELIIEKDIRSLFEIINEGAR